MNKTHEHPCEVCLVTACCDQDREKCETLKKYSEDIIRKYLKSIDKDYDGSKITLGG